MLRQLILDSCCYYLVDDLCDHNGETPIYRDLRTVELPERGDGEEDSVYWCKVLLQEGANPNAGINMPDGSVPSAAQARMLVDRGGVPNDDLIAWMAWHTDVHGDAFRVLLPAASEAAIRENSGNCRAVYEEALRRGMTNCVPYGDA